MNLKMLEIDQNYSDLKPNRISEMATPTMKAKNPQKGPHTLLESLMANKA